MKEQTSELHTVGAIKVINTFYKESTDSEISIVYGGKVICFHDYDGRTIEGMMNTFKVIDAERFNRALARENSPQNMADRLAMEGF